MGQACAVRVLDAHHAEVGRGDQVSDYDGVFANVASGKPSENPYDDVFKAIAPKVPEPAADAPAVVKAGAAINNGGRELVRQAGLTARYGMEGLANTAQIVTEPLRYLTDLVTPNRNDGQPKSTPLGTQATKFADFLGLPSPQNANERVVGDATRLMAGAGGMGAAARAATTLLPGAAQSVPAFANPVRQYVADAANAARTLPGGLSTNMGQQVAAAAGSGLAGGAVREAGGSPLMQGAAALVGGVGAGLGVQAAGAAGNKVATTARNLMPGQQQLVQQRLDQRINISLETQGIDPATITPAMRAAMRDQVGRALNTGGDLNPEAVARLADYTRLGMTPTRARLTLDPYDVTQEANAAKLAAATGSRDARLPQIAQDNNRRLVSTIDEMGGARPVDTYGQGNAAIAPILGRDASMEARTSNLYGAARDSAGRPAQMDGAAFTRQASQNLDEAMLGYALPADVQNRLNSIAQGRVPFTVDYVEQFKKQLNGLYASADRPTRAAISAVRSALDDAPLVAAPTVNPGNLPAVPGTVPPSPAALGREALDAFGRARASHAERMQWRESSPLIGRALDGAIPDTFIKNNIISKAAGFDGVERAAQTINADPAAREAVRTAIVHHLKDASIGKGGTSATGNFSGRGVEAALKDIGDRKLGLFFTPGELETLRSMARTGAFETFQPRGSAVNNSNTGAAIGSMLMGLADRVRPVTSKIPVVGGVADWAVLNPLENIGVWAAQRPALNVPQGLLMPTQRPPRGSGLLLPGIAAGGLLAAP
jgi:hypothetical protein